MMIYFLENTSLNDNDCLKVVNFKLKSSIKLYVLIKSATLHSIVCVL